MFTLNGTNYSVAASWPFIQHKVRLWTDRWGTDLTTAPRFVRYAARLIAERYAVVVV